MTAVGNGNLHKTLNANEYGKILSHLTIFAPCKITNIIEKLNTVSAAE